MDAQPIQVIQTTNNSNIRTVVYQSQFEFLKSMQYIIIFISIFVFTLSSYAQTAIQTYNWKTYTSFNSVTTILEIQDELWVGTKGGVIVYDTSGKQLRSFTTKNGLLELSVSTMYYDEKSGSIFVGYDNGIIDVYRNNEWKHITDILDASKQYPNRRINEMVSREDTLYVATAFGLVFFDTRTLTPLGQLDKFKSFSSLTSVIKIGIWNNELYALTPKILLKAPLQNNSLLGLQIAENWSVVQETGFLKDDEFFTQMEITNQNIYLANKKRVFKYNQFRLDTIHTSNYDITDLQALPNSIVFVYDNFSIRFVGGNSDLYFSHNEQNIPIGRIATGLYTKNSYFVGFENTGFGKVLALNSFNLFQNDGIIANGISSIGVDRKFTPWLATGGNPAGFGFTHQSKDRWKFYEKVNTPFIKDNVYDNVSALENGEIWISSFGVGTIRAIPTDSGYNFTRFDNSNSPLIGAVDSDPAYVITGQTCLDFSGNRFIINRYTKGGPLFCVLTPTNEWKTFGESIFQAENFDYNEVQMDRFGTFWVKSANRFQQNGILFFNYNRTLDNKSDDIWGTIKDIIGSNMPNPTAMAVDENSVVWVGTTTGLWRITNTSAILQNREPSITRSQLLSNITINHIAVDAINQKWVSTNEGIWVLNEDGTEVVQILTTSNSPLITNVISTIGIDKKSGIVYVGTSKGLQSFETPIVTPSEQFSLDCFPSPFVIRQQPFMTINGLEIDSEIRIVTSSGTLVRFLATTSGSINWDGKDMNGQYVPSGIYIVSARSSINNTTSVKKVFVKNNIHGG